MAITSNIQINKNGLCVNEVENIIINDKKRDISSVSSGAEKKKLSEKRCS